jgi:NTP pyrophosphatase (non-canonical NTP hydrolase)
VNKLQQMVAEFSERTGTRLELPYRALDLCSETGELAQEILRDARYGKQDISRVSEKAVAELGDSVFSLLSMANGMNVDIEEALAAAIERYGKRLERCGRFSE